MNQFKFVLEMLISLISHPQQTWQYLASVEDERSKSEYVQRNYYLPLWGFMSLVVFLCAAIHRDGTSRVFDIQLGMTQMVPLLVGFFVGPYLSIFVLRLVLGRFFDMPNPDKDRLHLFVFFCTSFLMSIELLIALFPSIRFFDFISLYLVYITWEAATVFVRVDETRRFRFCFSSFLVIYSCTWLVINLLTFMQK